MPEHSRNQVLDDAKCLIASNVLDNDRPEGFAAASALVVSFAGFMMPGKAPSLGLRGIQILRGQLSLKDIEKRGRWVPTSPVVAPTRRRCWNWCTCGARTFAFTDSGTTGKMLARAFATRAS